MTVKLTGSVEITLYEDDLLAILTDQFCGGYGAFAEQRAVSVTQADDGSFHLEFAPLEPEENARGR